MHRIEPVGAAQRQERFMKYVLAIIAATSICAAIPASAEQVGVGVGVGPVGAGVTVGSDHRDREPDRKVIIDRDRN
jgi:hypothetical protein